MLENNPGATVVTNSAVGALLEKERGPFIAVHCAALSETLLTDLEQRGLLADASQVAVNLATTYALLKPKDPPKDK